MNQFRIRLSVGLVALGFAAMALAAPLAGAAQAQTAKSPANDVVMLTNQVQLLEFIQQIAHECNGTTQSSNLESVCGSMSDWASTAANNDRLLIQKISGTWIGTIPLSSNEAYTVSYLNNPDNFGGILGYSEAAYETKVYADLLPVTFPWGVAQARACVQQGDLAMTRAYCTSLGKAEAYEANILASYFRQAGA